jgi:hypothetical protein
MVKPKQKKIVRIKDLYVSGPSELNEGKCAFTLTKKSKYAGVTFRLAGAELNEEGKILFQYEILYCPRAVKINEALAKEIGKVLNHVHRATEEVKEDVQGK